MYNRLFTLLTEGQTTGGDATLTGIRLGRFLANQSNFMKSAYKSGKDPQKRVNKIGAKIAKKAAKDISKPNKSKVAKFELDRFKNSYYFEPSSDTKQIKTK